MKKVDSVYVMKCRDAKDPYPHIVNGNFRKLESVMEKAEELKQISTTTQIDVWLKTKVTQDLARHSSIGITQRYVHLANDELDTQYNKVFNGY